MYSSAPDVSTIIDQPSLIHHFPAQPQTVPALPHPHTLVPQHRPQQPHIILRSPITVLGVPSVHIENNRLVVGSSQTSSTRSYTVLKQLGDGSFGTVLLCDWHGTLPPNTPLAAMQCGAGARPEWAGKRLVALKKMKRRREGGWDECKRLPEIESLRAIPFHPNIIPLYDVFFLPEDKELYFVFEPMEGNLYHLIKARKGRALAGGLVSSIFRQIVSGLDHIHASGYFHRDMKPENVLVTTTGLFDYPSLSPFAPQDAPPEKDVVAIIKLADFGLARETRSLPPYTEYVSTRWYRAPEVILYSTDYSNPVDMWALGTIMAELVNLRPLFPGADFIDQVSKICEVLGDPSDEYGLDSSHGRMGGGAWPRGVQMASSMGIQFPKMPPTDLHSLFDKSVPRSLVGCIRDLLRYDPHARLTSRECLNHLYFQETTPRTIAPTVNLPTSPQSPSHAVTPSSTLSSVSPHSLPSHVNLLPGPRFIPSIAITDRSSFTSSDDSLSPSHLSHAVHMNGHANHQAMQQNTLAVPSHIGPPPAVNDDFAMDVTPADHGDTYARPHVSDYDTSMHVNRESYADVADVTNPPTGKAQKRHFWKMFGGDKSHHNALPPVAEIPQQVASTSSFSVSSGSDNRSMRDASPPRQADVKKINKKEAERVQREAEKQRRALAEKMQREQARAVMQKRNQIVQKTTGKDDLEWRGGSEQRLDFSEAMKGKQASTGPIRQAQHHANGNATLNAAAGKFVTQIEQSHMHTHPHPPRRDQRWREFDDDHSVSSSDVGSAGRMSSISFASVASVDSDPGPSRIRNRPSLFGLNRMQSTSSLRTSFGEDFSQSARSSNSFSLDGQLAHDFRTLTTMNPATPLTGSMSPAQLQLMGLPSSMSPPPNWMYMQQQSPEPISSRRGHAPPYIQMPSPSHPTPPYSPFDTNGLIRTPQSPGHMLKTDVNPMLVVSYKWDEGSLQPDDISGKFAQSPLPPMSIDTDESLSSPTSLPPFSQLEAVAGVGYDYPPLSPMSFTEPSEDAL